MLFEQTRGHHLSISLVFPFAHHPPFAPLLGAKEVLA
jgi:hypothetical protein